MGVQFTENVCFGYTPQNRGKWPVSKCCLEEIEKMKMKRKHKDKETPKWPVEKCNELPKQMYSNPACDPRTLSQLHDADRATGSRVQI